MNENALTGVVLSLLASIFFLLSLLGCGTRPGTPQSDMEALYLLSIVANMQAQQRIIQQGTHSRATSCFPDQDGSVTCWGW